jgi:hypothetical protein
MADKPEPEPPKPEPPNKVSDEEIRRLQQLRREQYGSDPEE